MLSRLDRAAAAGYNRVMSTVQLRREAKSMIDGMSPRELRLVREFVASRDTNAATRELLAIPGFEKSFVRGIKDLKSGRSRPWREVRRDVKARPVAPGRAILPAL